MNLEGTSLPYLILGGLSKQPTAIVALPKTWATYSNELQVSVGWLLYNMLAPIMLLWHCLFRTRGLTSLCTLISMLTTLTLAAIVVIIWLVLPKDFNWNQQLRDSLTFFDAQKSGKLPASNPIPWRGDSALTDAAPNGSSLVGGYYIDGGKHLLQSYWCHSIACCLYSWVAHLACDFSDNVKRKYSACL